MYTLASEVHKCIKVTLIRQLSLSPGSSVGRGSGYKSQRVGSSPNLMEIYESML